MTTAKDAFSNLTNQEYRPKTFEEVIKDHSSQVSRQELLDKQHLQWQRINAAVTIMCHNQSTTVEKAIEIVLALESVTATLPKSGVDLCATSDIL